MTTTHDIKFTPYDFEIGSNRYKGYCGCGAFVPAGDGFYDGQVFCSQPGSVGDIGWVCEATAAREMETRAKAAAARKANRTYVPTEADLKRAEKHAAEDAEWAKRGLKRCGRCGGAGGASHWPGFTCYECGGSGAVIDN